MNNVSYLSQLLFSIFFYVHIFINTPIILTLSLIQQLREQILKHDLRLHSAQGATNPLKIYSSTPTDQ